MKDFIEEYRAVYQAAEIPEELGKRVDTAIFEAMKKRRPRRALRCVTAAAACFALLFIGALNVSPVLALELSDVPVIGQIARVCTFRSFVQQDESKIIQVRLPQIADTGNTDLERRINNEIRVKVDAAVDQARQNAKEMYDAYLSTGGDPAEYIPLDVHIDYEVKCSDADTLSFVITRSETRANVFTEYTFYNIDLETGRELTLRDLLGSDYRQVVTREVQRQMRERMLADPEALYFGYLDADTADPETAGERFDSIPEDQRFYINAAGNPVVVFEKYEIAPGYMGSQEFEIK